MLVCENPDETIVNKTRIAIVIFEVKTLALAFVGNTGLDKTTPSCRTDLANQRAFFFVMKGAYAKECT